MAKKAKAKTVKFKINPPTVAAPAEVSRDDEYRTRDDADQIMRTSAIYRDSKRHKAAADYIQSAADHVKGFRPAKSRQGRRKLARNIGRS